MSSTVGAKKIKFPRIKMMFALVSIISLLLSGCKESSSSTPQLNQEDSAQSKTPGSNGKSDVPLTGVVIQSTSVITDKIQGRVTLNIEFGISPNANVVATVGMKWSSSTSSIDSKIDCPNSEYLFDKQTSTVRFGVNGDCVQRAIEQINFQVPEGEQKLPCPIVAVASDDGSWTTRWTAAMFDNAVPPVKVGKIPPVKVGKMKWDKNKNWNKEGKW